MAPIAILIIPFAALLYLLVRGSAERKRDERRHPLPTGYLMAELNAAARRRSDARRCPLCERGDGFAERVTEPENEIPAQYRATNEGN